MDIFTHHRKTAARRTMKLSCEGSFILGGMDHVEAAKLLNCHTPGDCICIRANLHTPLSIQAVRAMFGGDDAQLLGG